MKKNSMIDNDSLIVEELQNAYRLNSKLNYIDCSDDEIPPDDELLNAIDMVLDYFMTPEQASAWKVKKLTLNDDCD